MIKREAGFLGLAKQNAKRKGMVKVPKQYDIRGEPHYAIYATKDEMQTLKDGGGTGEMTKYDIPAFPAYNPGGTEKSSSDKTSRTSSAVVGDDGMARERGGKSRPQAPPTPTATAPKKPEFRIGYDKSKSLWENIKDIDIPGWIAQEWDKLDFSGKPKGDLTDAQKMQALENNPDAQQQVMGNMGGPDAAAAAKEGAKQAAYEADRQEDYEKKQEREGKKQGFLDEYTGFQGEAAGLGKRSQDLSEGAMTDASGKVEGQEGYDASTATRQGGFAGDVKKLGAYEDKFGDIAADAKIRGDTAQTEFGGAAETGAGKLEGIGEGYKGVTGQAGVDAAAKGTAGFVKGAGEVSGIQEQFGKEGFQKDVRGMSEKALSGDVGQREAGMLKGRMEEQRMASQKGSEEKLRREMAQSGASPAEIAQKVAQFQRQSAAQQQQAGRSEALSSQLQGQQMGQSQLSQAAQLKGQEAGMAGKQAGLAVQQAALRGQGAAMEMQGAQAQDQTKLASLQGQGAMAQAGAGMRMEGVKGGAELGMAGAAQQGTMLGQGMGAVQAAGGARAEQREGLTQEGGFIDQQGNYVQAKLASTEADITQASTEEQARLTRKAQGTPDDPRYRPPAETAPAVGTDTGGLPPGTTVAPQPPGTTAPASTGGQPGTTGRSAPVQGAPAMPPPADAVASPAPASQGGINAAPPGGAPVNQAKPQDAQSAYKGYDQTVKAGPGGGMADAQARQAYQPTQAELGQRQAAMQNMTPEQQKSAEAQNNQNAQLRQQGGLMGQKGMMGAQQGGMGQQGMMMEGQMAKGQGNNRQAMMQNEQSRAEATKQMGQAGAVRGSWKDAQGGGAGGGGGVASMMGGGGGSPFGGQGLGMIGQGQAGIAQQGGMMGQGQVSPEQQQAAEAMHKKRREAMMQGFAVGGA